MLWRALGHIENGFYIDVGAQHPETHSVTKFFYDNGWAGINFEPVNQWHRLLESDRTRDINLKVAAGSCESSIDFYEIPDTGLSTSDQSLAMQHTEQLEVTAKRVMVPVTTVFDVCNKYKVGPIHFLKIDCEGAEEAVLAGTQLALIRPWVVIIEATAPLSEKLNHESWEHHLKDNKYRFVYFDGLNRFYVSEEKYRELKLSFLTPPNVFDNYKLSIEVQAKKTIEAQTKAIKTAEKSTESLHHKIDSISESLKSKSIRNVELRRLSLSLIHRLKEELANGKTLLENSENSSGRSSRKIHSLEAELLKANIQITEVELKNSHLERVIASNQVTIALLHDSYSWRVTKPLRALYRLMKIDHFKSLASEQWKRAILYLMEKPKLVSAVHLVVDHIPSLRKRIEARVESAIAVNTNRSLAKDKKMLRHSTPAGRVSAHKDTEIIYIKLKEEILEKRK